MSKKRSAIELHPLYTTWRGMRHRCNCKTSTAYKWYGGRGIKVCDRWNDFWAFVSDVGLRPDGMSLDRIDNDGHYEPSNVRWASSAVQHANRRVVARPRRVPRVRERYEFDGKQLTLAQWAKHLGWSYSVLYNRLHHVRKKRPWPLNLLFTIPPRKKISESIRSGSAPQNPMPEAGGQGTPRAATDALVEQ